MKKKRIALALVALMVTGLVGCGNSSTSGADQLKVGMVTDAGTIDDKSFNQGTWEGISRAKDELNVDANYLKPAGTTEADYMKEIGNLYDTDYKFIVTPGFKFETAIFQAQDRYSDSKFIIIDGSPNNGKTGSERVEKVGENTVSVYFAEEEAGFLAGVAAAVELKTGDLGFIGGMEIPSVQKFNWGFQQGVKYANENLGTSMSLKAENIVYQGTFDNVAAGQQLAATMYDNGVRAIFTAAGGVGVGSINEAKTRAAAGKEAWIIGVDVDQYADGLMENGKSIILTSAVKKIDNATYDIIKDELNGSFPGGKTLTFNAKNDGIGLPKENPNLSAETMSKVDEVYNKIKNDEIKISTEQGDLIK
ncbi:BMP family ABC transporter substrate-binding protein [Clostridium sartagoforme]|uniref:BMP family ABC transporter substrate-binding protein n=1 Tax=Clostridium sartagoforme TaxID=84031 RepID=A0A4S2DR48_9CLOT|nr:MULTISPECIES: BMP family ABC transporter substrate-binding protein [Clostridium]MBS5936736.1 BMP family ABC transporter substrate-binding protein [Clostridium sp.]TGY43653.1 BMP family ABC transporter substrate-binding protein [Clostridium sartagoforme]